MIPFALVVLLACQDPAPTPAPAASTPAPLQSVPSLDVIELKNGDTLEGRITAEVDGYVELKLGEGATIGVSTATVARIRRGAGGAPPGPQVPLPVHAEWFVLHDAAGECVGWLRTTVSTAADGSYTLGEEYEFVAGRRRFQVTSLATAGADQTPRSCYFRERQSEPVLASLQLGLGDGSQQERVVDERIVEAKVADGRLQVQHLDRHGRREREFAWPEHASFPLLARTQARRGGAPIDSLPVFDPATEEMATRSYDGSRRRRVVHDGEPMFVQEVAEASAAGRNSEWLDAQYHTLRRELAGPSLVAVPSSAESMKLAVGATSIPRAVVAEAGGSFGLWLPNPAWAPRDELPAGQVALVCEAHGASVALSRLDHLEPGLSLDSAADAVANWFSLLHPELRLGERQSIPVRERSAVRLLAQGRRARVAWRATIDVIPQRERFVVLVCCAPSAAWDELAPDFAFLLRSIELEAQALAPRLQGPLAAGHGKGKDGDAAKPTAKASAAAAPSSAGGATPTPTPTSQPPVRDITVRIPD